MSKRMQVISNSFPITRLPTKEYFMYDGAFSLQSYLCAEITDLPTQRGPTAVVFLPDIEQREKRQKLFYHLQVSVAPQLFHPRLVYDGKAIAYSPGLLDLGGNSGITFNIRLGQSAQSEPGDRGSFQLRLNLTSSPPIVPNDVRDLINKGVSSTRSATATNLIQLIIRQGPNLHNTNNGRAYFTGKDKQPLNGSGIELWRGIFQSVRPTLGKMILTVDTTTALVYKSGMLINVAMDFLDIRQNVRGLRLSDRDLNFKKLEKFLKKLRIKVKTGVNGTKSRIKTIRGLVPAAGEYIFEKGGEAITVQQHFYRAYGIRIEHPGIIGVRLTGQKASHQDVVPAELCEIEYGQLYRQKIPDKFTSEMVKFSTMRPQQRLQKIMDGAKDVNNSDYIVESGMSVEPHALKVNAKVLTTPGVGYGRDYNLQVANGAWNVLGRTLHDPQFLNSWAIVNFCPDRINPDHCQHIIRELGNSCTSLGMGFQRPHDVYIGHGQNVENDLNRAMEDIAGRLRGDAKMLARTVLVVLLPSSAAQIRTAVKCWGDAKHGIRTQCLRENKVSIAKNQYWNNVVLKLNARLGGRNQKGLSPAMAEFEKVPFIVMGADVGHPGPGVLKPSVTSVVYSHDMHATQYAAIMGIQNPRTEIIENLKEYVAEAVDSWGQKNQTAPRNILFFRDGVSEGEYERVSEIEIQAIRDACKAVWEKRRITAPLPLLTFIVVGKRHHAVFFPVSSQEGDRTGNLYPGSVIDTDITHPGLPNFYLQSHAAIQGTCRSSHYIVLEDQIFNSRNDLSKIQSLAYTLCHVYAKATRSVSIPAPVYYADLVCSRGPFHINPDAPLDFDEGMSVSSGHTTFELSTWQAAFLKTNTTTGMDKTMYFL